MVSSFVRRRLALWWKEDPIRGLIVSAVIFIHFTLLLTLAYAEAIHPKKDEPKKLIVKTISTQPKPKLSMAQTPKATTKKNTTQAAPAKTQPSPPPKKPPAPAPKTKPAPPSKTETTVTKKTPPPKKPSAAKQTAPSPSQNLLKEAEEKLSKIAAKQDNTPRVSSLPPMKQIEISSFSKTEESSSFSSFEEEDSWTEFLIGYLQQKLKLPDFGEVTIQLSVQGDGRVSSVRIVKSESTKNTKYLEENLTKIIIPSTYLKKNEINIFVLTFCNEL